MTEKELHKLNRVQILELFLEQCKRNEALEAELADVKAKLESKTIAIESSGSIAEASLKLTNIFEEAQKAADYYLANIKRVAGVEDEAETVDDSAESSEGAVAEVSEEVSDAVAEVSEEAGEAADKAADAVEEAAEEAVAEVSDVVE